jgi:RNA polymerase sigma-70 factor (ECF subfamily)
MPLEPENSGLLSLMLLQDSRRAARVSLDGELATMEEKDRSLWDRKQVAEGLDLIARALRMGAPGPYQLQAAIAAVHAEAVRAGETDWPQIIGLYRELMRVNPSAVVRLNYGVAVAMGESLERGLAVIDGLELNEYYLFHAARADLLRRLGRRAEAGTAYERALSLATNGVERNFLRKRLAMI